MLSLWGFKNLLLFYGTGKQPVSLALFYILWKSPESSPVGLTTGGPSEILKRLTASY